MSGLGKGVVSSSIAKLLQLSNQNVSCVKIIPHITDEIKNRIRKIAEDEKLDILVVECGGTVGDIESLPFLEALRQIRTEDGPENVIFVHVTLAPSLDVVGEQKTKPTQHSVQ